MFGFGRSANEKAVINLFALQIEKLGLSTKEARGNATKLVDEILSDFRPRGIDPYKSTQGDEYIKREQFIAPRLAAGLSLDDIRSHWNRPVLTVVGEMKMRELTNFIIVDAARQQGKDTSAAALQYKKIYPRYGDPARWDPNEKFNAGLTEADADIYPEFSSRVDRWRERTRQHEFDELVSKHGTLNAVIRHLVATGIL